VALQNDKSVNQNDLSRGLDAAIRAAGLKLGIARIVDVLGAAVGLIFFSPILLITAVAIKLDSRGPVFVREMQFGSKNERIEVLKLRLATNHVPGHQKSARLTRIGSILRGTRVDELPWLINVLRGEASFFGPRS
jgi:lipopolysaccharide/colanic/teichoic acid biosynthesis glycosyltransferase